MADEVVKKQALQEDNQRGVSQDALEDLRTEFLSVGGIIQSLPDPKSVRDNTIVMIRNLDYKIEVYSRYQMINGNWYWIGDALPSNPFHISATITQKNSATVIGTSAGTGTIVDITTGWTSIHKENITYKQAGVYEILSDGEYYINWQLSIDTGTANKSFEAGVIINGSEYGGGWSHSFLTTTSAETCLSGNTIVDLKKGDLVNLAIRCMSSPAVDVTIDHADFTIVKRGR